MKEFLRKKLAYIIPSLITFVILIIYFLLYDIISTNVRIRETLNINGSIVAVILFGLYLYYLESKRGRDERRLLQRLELRKRALECFEEINKLIIKTRLYKTTDSYDVAEIRVSFDQMANFFVELREIYKELPGVIPNLKDADGLDSFYQGWDKYFSFEKPDDLNKLRKSINDAEGYLICLKKALIKFTRTLQLE